MKYYKNLNIYKNSTGTLTYSPNNCIGYSYGHYTIVKKYKDTFILTNYYYSATTIKHYYKILNLLKSLYGENVKMLTVNCEIIDTIGDIISTIEDQISSLKSKIEAKGTKASANEKRKLEIHKLQVSISLLLNLK